MTWGVTLGLPSRSPPIQVPKVSGRVSSGRWTPTRSSSAVRSSRTSPTALKVQLVEVVDGVAGLVGGFGAHHAQFVRLPDEVDVLRQAGVEAAPVGGEDRGLQQGGDAAELVEDGAAGRLGGVGGEDGPHVEVADGLAQVFGVGVLEPVGGAGEQAALGGAAGGEFASAVHLFGDVGQVEVGGEGAYQLGGRLEFGAAQQLCGGLAVLAGEAADLLDEVEELRALLPDERLSEEVAQSADVGTQFGARRGGLVVGTAHRCGSLQCWKLVWEGTRTSVSRGVCRLRAGRPGRNQSGPRCPTDFQG